MTQPFDCATRDNSNRVSVARRRPYPRYRDSGVESLYEIPAHWKVERLKRICAFEYGDSLPSERRTYGDIPVYGSNGAVGTHQSANALGPWPRDRSEGLLWKSKLLPY